MASPWSTCTRATPWRSAKSPMAAAMQLPGDLLPVTGRSGGSDRLLPAAPVVPPSRRPSNSARCCGRRRTAVIRVTASRDRQHERRQRWLARTAGRSADRLGPVPITVIAVKRGLPFRQPALAPVFRQPAADRWRLPVRSLPEAADLAHAIGEGRAVNCPEARAVAVVIARESTVWALKRFLTLFASLVGLPVGLGVQRVCLHVDDVAIQVCEGERHARRCRRRSLRISVLPRECSPTRQPDALAPRERYSMRRFSTTFMPTPRRSRPTEQGPEP